MPEIPHKEGLHKVHKKSFIVLVNVINNIFCPWMRDYLFRKPEVAENNSGLYQPEE